MNSKHNKRMSDVAYELQTIAYDTGLKLNRVKDYHKVLHIHERMFEEQQKVSPACLLVEPQNRLSLYFTINCLKRVNTFN